MLGRVVLIVGLLLGNVSLAAEPMNAPFEGRVVKILDGQTLQVLRQGKPVTIRIRDLPASASQNRLRALVEQQTVTIIVYDRAADGKLIGEVILPTGGSLSEEVAPSQAATPPVKPSMHQVSSPQNQQTPLQRVGETSTNTSNPIEYELAVINAKGFVPKDHITVARFRSLLDQLTTTFVENRQQIADMTVKAQELLKKEGVQETLLNMMEGMNQLFLTPIANQRYAEYAAAYVTLRQKGDAHAVAIRGLQGILRGVGVR